VLISLENYFQIDPNFHQSSCWALAMMAASLAQNCVLHFDWSHLVKTNCLPMSPMNDFWLLQNCCHFVVVPAGCLTSMGLNHPIVIAIAESLLLAALFDVAHPNCVKELLFAQ
jgi:hypothetical protein